MNQNVKDYVTEKVKELMNAHSCCAEGRAIRAPGLPGKVAPRSAAAAIRDSVYHILEERGEPI